MTASARPGEGSGGGRDDRASCALQTHALDFLRAAEFSRRMKEKKFKQDRTTTNGRRERIWEGLSIWKADPEVWNGREVPN